MAREQRQPKQSLPGSADQPQGAPLAIDKRLLALVGFVLVGAFFWWQQYQQTFDPHESTRAVEATPNVVKSPTGSTATSAPDPSPLGSSQAKQTPPAATPVASHTDDPAPAIQADATSSIPIAADRGTEAIAASTNKQLQALAKIILKARTLETPQIASQLAPLVAKDFRCGPLRPRRLVEEFDDGAIVVRRSEQDNSDNDDNTGSIAKTHQGREGLATALKALVEPWQDKPTAWCKFKQFLIEPGSETIRSTSYYEIGSRRSDNTKAEGLGTGQHARWVCRWEPGRAGTPPRLLSIDVSDFEETITRSKQGTLFSDCTVAVLGRHAEIEDQLFHGTNYWRGRIEKRYRIPYFGQQGLALGDVNGDGLDDVYLLQPGGLPNRLLVHQADGTVVDQSQAAGVDILDFTRSALLIDLDNDGDQDLVVSMWKRLMFLANDGQGHFTAKAVLSDMKAAYSLAAADYDQDGDLDLFACIYYPKEAAADRIAEPIPYYNATNGGKNVLVRNEGDWQFAEVTDEVGLGENNFRFSFAASWDDYDNDGDLDLYVANDFGPNHLYRNDRGHFTDVAAKVGAEDMNFGMSASWGDFNRDGWMDMYISNMFSSAGNRVTFQSEFKSNLDDRLRNKYQKLARGNSLLANHGGKFADVSNEQHVTVGRWAWGSLFVDVNNDGWEDLMVANGFITGTKTDDL